MPREEYLSIQSKVDGQIGYVTLGGRLMAESRFELDRILRDWRDSGLPFVIISCRELEFIDSAGLSTMIGARQRLKRLGGDLILSEMNPELLSYFDRASMQSYFTIFDGVPEAKLHFKAEILARRRKGKSAEIEVKAPTSAIGKPKPRRAATAAQGRAKKQTEKRKAAAGKKPEEKKGGRKKAAPRKKAVGKKAVKKRAVPKKKAVKKQAAPKRKAIKKKTAKKKAVKKKKSAAKRR